MKQTLLEGVTGRAEHRVVTENLVSFRKPKAPAVLATPWLLYIMETAAYNAILPHLDPGEASVGVGFDFQHLAATPVGSLVTAEAKITKVEGKKVHLDFQARDEKELIAKGKHVRAIIEMARFQERLKKKTG